MFAIVIAVIALVVGLSTYALLRWKADWIRVRVLPREILFIDSAEERFRVQRCAGKALLRQRSTWIAFIAYCVVSSVLDLTLRELIIADTYGGRWPVVDVGTAIISRLVIPFSLAPLLFLWLRRWMRVYLREYLNDHGMPICRNCGYDLRGDVSGTCSECGTAFDEKDAADDESQ
jgi:hypothetical protein